MDTPASAAADVEAALIEWALKMVVSMPAFARTVLIHRAIVALVAGPCGLVEVRNTFSRPFSVDLSFLVLLQY